jgi:hypothetical protein
VWAGSRLRVILNAESRDIEALKAFNAVVIEANVAHSNLAKTGRRFNNLTVLSPRHANSEAVVVGGHLNLAGLTV